MTTQTYHEKLMLVHLYTISQPDGILRTICFLYSTGCNDNEILRRLKIPDYKLKLLKQLIRQDLINIGIEPPRE